MRGGWLNTILGKGSTMYSVVGGSIYSQPLFVLICKLLQQFQIQILNLKLLLLLLNSLSSDNM
jgi:hypothetical protein